MAYVGVYGALYCSVRVVPGNNDRPHGILPDGNLDDRDYWVAQIQRLGLRKEEGLDVGENVSLIFESAPPFTFR